VSLRFIGPEFNDNFSVPTTGYATTGLGAAQEIQTPHELKKNLPLWGLLVTLRMRLAIGGTNVGAKFPESIWNFIQRVRVEGKHRILGTRTLVNVSGPILREYCLLHQAGFAPLAVVGTTLSTAADPLPTPAANQNNDIELVLPVPFVPLALFPRQQALYALNSPDWDVLNVWITFGDASVVYAFNAGQVVTFSNFGGATGSPQCNIYMLRYLLGGARNLIRPAVRRLDMLPMDSALQSGGGGDVPIRDLTVGYKAVHYLIKTGTLAAGLSAGARAYGSLSDTIITRPKIKVDNVVKRDCGPSDPYVMKSYVAFQLESVNPEIGYNVIHFAEGHNASTFFPADGLTSKNTYQLAGDYTAAANQIGDILQELIEGEPVVFTPDGVARQGVTGQVVSA